MELQDSPHPLPSRTPGECRESVPTSEECIKFIAMPTFEEGKVGPPPRSPIPSPRRGEGGGEGAEFLTQDESDGKTTGQSNRGT